MILDYPEIEEKELFFAYALRFHRFSGALSLNQSFGELFQRKYWPETTAFLKCSKQTLEILHLNIKEFIEQHTVIPFYRTFLPEKQYMKFSPEEIVEQPYKICFSLPKKHDSLKQNNQHLWYCPICHSYRSDYSDVQIYHQVSDVHVCEKHGCFLKSIFLRDKHRLANPEKWDVSFEMCSDEWLQGIAGDVKYILDAKPEIFVESFADRLWNYVEKCSVEYQLSVLEERVKRALENLPDRYCSYFKDFRLRKYMNLDYNPNIAIIEYLIVVRAVFGSFQAFVEWR